MASATVVEIPLLNSSFEDFSGAVADDATLTGVAPSDGLVQSTGPAGSTTTIPGWQLFLETPVAFTVPRGWDDDQGAFDGSRYAFANGGVPAVVWSDADTSTTYSEGDWVTVTWSQANGSVSTLNSQAYLSFDGTASGDLPQGQTGQGGVTGVGSRADFDTSLGAFINARGPRPELYTTHSRLVQLTAAEAAGANANGVRVGVRAGGNGGGGGQWRIDNVLLSLRAAPTVTPVVLIDESVGNGSFEDLSGAFAAGVGATNDLDLTPGVGDDGVLLLTDNEPITIPGWTLRDNGVFGVDDNLAASDGSNYVFADGADGNPGAVSDVVGAGVTFQRGDVIRITYDQARGGSDSGLMGFSAALGFDGTADPSIEVAFGQYDATLSGDGAGAFETETALYRLTAFDAMAANENGIRLSLSALNGSSEQSRLDNVGLELIPIGVDGLLGDFNGDGVVDLADYTVWRDALGDDDDDALGDLGDGFAGVTLADYEVWLENFGETAAVMAIGVPEPAGAAILLIAAAAGLTARSRV